MVGDEEDLLEITRKAQQEKEELPANGAAKEPVCFYDMFTTQLKSIIDEPSDINGTNYCLVQTKGQLKGQLMRMNT